MNEANKAGEIALAEALQQLNAAMTAHSRLINEIETGELRASDPSVRARNKEVDLALKTARRRLKDAQAAVKRGA